VTTNLLSSKHKKALQQKGKVGSDEEVSPFSVGAVDDYQHTPDGVRRPSSTGAGRDARTCHSA
jgi:hypothetical protein